MVDKLGGFSTSMLVYWRVYHIWGAGHPHTGQRDKLVWLQSRALVQKLAGYLPMVFLREIHEEIKKGCGSVASDVVSAPGDAKIRMR